tara:strand:+ start:1554 stop:1826 length:273 start_codon:yes stop_codon:yes gene_type:complete
MYNYYKMSNKPKGYCEWCGGILVAVGSARANGADHDDWTTRKLHKRCYKEKKEEEKREKRISDMEAVYERLRQKSLVERLGKCMIDLSKC